jgi:hypothetical protein
MPESSRPGRASSRPGARCPRWDSCESGVGYDMWGGQGTPLASRTRRRYLTSHSRPTWVCIWLNLEHLQG